MEGANKAAALGWPTTKKKWICELTKFNSKRTTYAE